MKNLIKFSFKQLSSKLFNKRIYSFNKLNLKKFFCDKSIEETLESQFEKLVENNDNDIEKSIKLVSVKLLSINKSSEAINFWIKIHQRTYKRHRSRRVNTTDIFLHIIGRETESFDSGNRLNIIDKRFDKYMKMIEDKIAEMI